MCPPPGWGRSRPRSRSCPCPRRAVGQATDRFARAPGDARGARSSWRCRDRLRDGARGRRRARPRQRRPRHRHLCRSWAAGRRRQHRAARDGSKPPSATTLSPHPWASRGPALITLIGGQEPCRTPRRSSSPPPGGRRPPRVPAFLRMPAREHAAGTTESGGMGTCCAARVLRALLVRCVGWPPSTSRSSTCPRSAPTGPGGGVRRLLLTLRAWPR